MERIKEILRKIFCLPPILTIFVSVPSFVLVFTILAFGVGGVVSYIAYLLSAYSMIIMCTGFPGIMNAIKEYISNHPLKKKILNIPFGNKLINDVFFRTKIGLYPALFINLLYAGIKMFSGIYYRSLWFAALSFYYILLALMRVALLRSVSKYPLGENQLHELRRYRICGVFLLIMNQALTVIVVLVIYQNSGFDYPGVLIYAMAMYAFYAVISAIISLVKNRNCGSPIISATKVIKLTAALVSMLSLETAMLARFGGKDDIDFRRLMTGISGGVICLFVLGMAIYMIVKSTRQIKELRQENSET